MEKTKQDKWPIFFIYFLRSNCLWYLFLSLKIVKIYFHWVPLLVYSGLQNTWILKVKAVKSEFFPVQFRKHTHWGKWALGTRATISWNCNKFFKLLQFHGKSLSVPGYFSFFVLHFFLKKFVSATKKNFKSIWNFFLLLLKQIFWEKREFVKKVNKNYVSHMNVCNIILFN